ncbi:UPF0158 family protein [Geomonas sp. RF6]|uniref:UPF0158 family protein n=1 Tax=Geomonas sp. RF6 TaxID=2897342 RepID=UPI001E2FE837|nr:UPF0158 family protein [Geomonas sp. RF6]UFS69501.1 UPF0158 family protein [Geomonas sp. RF6]
MRFGKIEDAFYFVSSAAPGDHVAVLNRKTGELFFGSDLAGHDHLPDDLDRNEDDYLEIPHKNDLCLGIAVVTDFVRTRCTEHMDTVRGIFSRPGAYSRYKSFLSEVGLLQEWYCFEMDRLGESLLSWCRESGVDLEDRS